MKKYGWMLVLIPVALLSACSPAVGSDKWCEKLKAKPKGDWSINEAKDFASHCLIK